MHHSNVEKPAALLKQVPILTQGDIVDFELGPGQLAGSVQALKIHRTRKLVGPGVSAADAREALGSAQQDSEATEESIRQCYNTLLHALGAEIELNGAIELLNEMTAKGISCTESAIGCVVTSCIWSRRNADAAQMFLKMRDLWHAEQNKWEERGLSFYDFNRPYQESFAELRRAVGLPYPDMMNALASYREMVPCDREYLLHQDQDHSGHQVIHVAPLTVMSFNVLAEYLSDLFSFQFVVIDETCNGDFLDWNARKSQVIGEVLRWAPQVLCLQELDRRHWPELQKELGQWGGYEAGPYIARKGRNGTEVLHGICTLYNLLLLLILILIG